MRGVAARRCTSKESSLLTSLICVRMLGHPKICINKEQGPALEKGIIEKNVKPARRRELAKQVQSTYDISVCVACSALSISATS